MKIIYAIMRSKVLLVDDDEDILDLLKYNLSREGFDVHILSDSSSTISYAKQIYPDLIVLDLMMPGINGIEICREIRKINTLSEIYIFFLTAKSDEYYKHATFNVGGDDFIEKVIGIKPLLNKIQAVLKRDFIIRKQRMRVKAGSLELFRGVETAYLNGSKILLNKSEFEILFFLAQNPGKRISVDDIIETLWGSQTYMDRSTAITFLDNLQQKFGNFIVRDRRSGYYLFR